MMLHLNFRTGFRHCLLAGACCLSLPATGVRAQPVPLGTAANFAILAGSTITNTGTSLITGNIGVSPGSAITGFPPGIVNGTAHSNDAVAIQAQIDQFTAFNNLAGRPSTANLTGQDLGGHVLTPGVYTFNSSAQLTGTLTLNGLGNPNALFVFNIGSTLTTASASSIVLINGARGGDVFFRVGSSATLGTTTSFVGDIIALTSITLNTGANINCGAALAHNGAVTLDTNNITFCAAPPAPLASLLPPAIAPIGNVLDTIGTNGGTLPLAFQNLISFLSPAELAAALTQLSGEGATAVAPAGVQAMNSFLSLVLSPFDEDRSVPPAPRTYPIKTLGYAPEASAGPFGSSYRTTAVPDPRRWGVWAAAYGGTTSLNGDAAAGTHNSSASAFGFATGFDYRVTPDTRVGFAIAGGGTNFGVAENLGGGHSDMLQAAIYGRTYFDAAYVAGALAYAWHDVTTDRFLSIAGTDHLTASFSAHNIAARIEGGYRFAMPEFLGVWPGRGWFTPYGAVQAQAFRTPAFSESAMSGSSVFALNFNARTTTDVRTELGFWTTRAIPLNDGAVLSLRTRTAWAHDFWSDPTLLAGFQSLPGTSFTVTGAAPVSDSALFLAGAEIKFRNGVSIAGWFDSALAPRAQTYTGTARLRYTF
jgi:uncharacterized protein with beta-barrel porin domain